MKKLIGGIAGMLLIIGAWEPETARTAATEALRLCTQTLIPTLFPFFVCTNILIHSGLTKTIGKRLESPLGMLFGVRGEGAAAVLLGFCSGYPSGAVVAARLYQNGRIHRNEAERLLAFTNNPSPLFIIGALGGVYHSTKIGYLLLASTIFSSILTGIFMRHWGTGDKKRRPVQEARIGDPMHASISTMARLCGFVILFAVVTAYAERLGVLPLFRHMLTKLGSGKKTAAMVTSGIFEVSALAERAGALPAMAGLVALGGVSVFLQVWDITRRAGLSIRSYLVGKLLSGGLSALLCRLFLIRFPVAEDAAAVGEKLVGYGAYLGVAIIGSGGLYAAYRLALRFRDKKHRAT